MHQPDIVQVNPAALQGVGLLPVAMPSSMHFIVDWRQIAWPTFTSPTSRVRQRAKHGWRTYFSMHHFHRATFLHEAGAEKFLGPKWPKWADVVPLGVSAHFLRSPLEGSEKTGQDVVRFLYIGSLSRVRQLECILQAAVLLKRRTRNFQVTLVGPDNASDYFQQLILEYDISDVVSIRPPVSYEKIPETVRKFDVTLAYVPTEPKDWQYHPTLKALEYRALGAPILGTDVAPNRDIIEHGKNGLLTSNLPQYWADAMNHFISNQRFLATTTANSRRMRTGNSWSDVAAQYESRVYQPLVAGSRRNYLPIISDVSEKH